ncbi:MAG: hypothetical protein WEA34_10115 [Gemmatimonadota bacterium]
MRTRSLVPVLSVVLATGLVAPERARAQAVGEDTAILTAAIEYLEDRLYEGARGWCTSPSRTGPEATARALVAHFEASVISAGDP